MPEKSETQLIPVDLDSRIARLQADQRNLEAEHQRLMARLKEVESAFIATSGALEILNQMKQDPTNQGSNGHMT